MSLEAELRTIQDEHRELLHNLHQLTKLARDTDHPADTWMPQVQGQLQQMERSIEGHFKREENGIYQTVVTQRPTLARRIEEFQGEHGALLEGLRILICAFSAAAVLPELRSGVLEWLHGFGSHEARETEFLHEALTRDVGVHD